MEVKATARYVRVSPRKVRRVLAGLRGLPVREAQARLQAIPGPLPRTVGKVLKSAVANAENTYELDPDDLVVARAYADRGPAIKRLVPRARGRADIAARRSSHITIVVGERATR
ncbi:MAG: 50S ribosomal protein L22 [Firmicutes bacterium]|jgi:large subunit ribosomal protein L22|nr:50S ribosomal protein L22 [Bacillota bacterium]